MAAAISGSIKFKLSVMMFLQFFIWGAWFELGFDYIPSMNFAKWQSGLIFGAFNIGALAALFFSTQFADRKFAAEKFLAFSHLVGGLAIMGLYFLPVGPAPDPVPAFVRELTSSDAAARESAEKRIDKLSGIENREKLQAELAKQTQPKQALPEDGAKLVAEILKKDDATKVEAEPRVNFWLFFTLMLIHSLFYVPTISITNSIAFNAMTDPAKQFGPIRVWGTIGWIAASWPFIFILIDWNAKAVVEAGGFIDKLVAGLGSPLKGEALLEGQRAIFLVAGIAALVLAAFSLRLPHTPPKPATGEDSIAWLKAMKLLKHPFVLVLFIVTFIDAAVHQSFFYWTASFLGPVKDAPTGSESGQVGIPSNLILPVMKIGQIAEIITMLFLGYVLKTFGWRITMIVGVLGHAARFAVFAFYPEQWACVVVNVLHGVCYAFFFATVYIFVDEYFPKDIRSSAQGLFNVLILGFGPFIANFACGELGAIYTPGKLHNYRPVFEYSLGAATVGAILLLLFFHPKPSVTAKI